MEPRLAVLKLLLQELGISPGVKALRDRKAIQKAVYLAQASGVDLGYRYGWYIMGPYSPKLTRDYFELAEQLPSETSGPERLQDEVRSKLDTAKPLLDVPDDVDLEQPQWLELLASVAFLRNEQGLDFPVVQKRLEEEKRDLSMHAHEATQRLQKAGLLR